MHSFPVKLLGYILIVSLSFHLLAQKSEQNHKNFVFTDIGNWQAIDRAGIAIFGSITFVDDKIYWGVSVKNKSTKSPPCFASYLLQRIDCTHWVIHLKHKHCHYKTMNNAKHSKLLSFLSISTLSESYGKKARQTIVSVKSFDKKAKLQGENFFQHQKKPYYDTL